MAITGLKVALFGWFLGVAWMETHWARRTNALDDFGSALSTGGNKHGDVITRDQGDGCFLQRAQQEPP